MDVSDDEVIKSLKNKSIVTKLVKNSRNSRVISTNSAYYYIDKDGKYKVLSGLLPRLRKTFFPDTNFYNIMKSPKESVLLGKINKIKRKNSRKTGQQKQRKKKKSKGRFHGLIRGTKVHQELEDFIFMDKKNFLKKHPSIHVYTRKILTFLLETMKSTPLRSEFLVFDEKLGIGTEVDLIGANKNGQLELYEVKTGYQDSWDNDDGYMERSLYGLTNSPHHQADIQLISAAMIISRNHNIPLSDMLLYVIRVDDEGLYYYKINHEYVIQKGLDIYTDLLAAA